jgi:hypothetical protein
MRLESRPSAGIEAYGASLALTEWLTAWFGAWVGV